jgi:hypothetical protein
MVPVSRRGSLDENLFLPNIRTEVVAHQHHVSVIRIPVKKAKIE